MPEAQGAAWAGDGVALEQARREADSLWERFEALALDAEREAERLDPPRRPVRDSRGGSPVIGYITPPSRRPARPPGATRTRLGAMLRRFNCDEGKLLLVTRLAEAALLPALSAANAVERERVNRLIGFALRLDEAVASGTLDTYTVCWQATGRWPRRPRRVRLGWGRGPGHGEQVLGEHRPELQALMDGLIAERRQADRAASARQRWDSRHGDAVNPGPATP